MSTDDIVFFTTVFALLIAAVYVVSRNAKKKDKS